jgi:hypothetical protein
MQILRNSVSAYFRSWKTAAVTITTIFGLLGFSLYWSTGCIPLPWVFPVPWIDKLINTMALPLIAILFILILGVFFGAIRVVKGRRQKFIAFMLRVFCTILTIGGLGYGYVLVIVMGPTTCSETPISQAHAVDWALDIAVLPPLPASAQQIRATSAGNALDRSTTVHFEAQSHDVEKWLTSRLQSVGHRLPNGSVEYAQDGGGTSVNLTVSADGRMVDLLVSQWL